MNLYAHFSPDNGCYRHRILNPFRYCSQDFPEQWNWELALGDPLKPYDCYLLHGAVPIRNNRYIAEWKRKGGIFVWGVDDDLPAAPVSNPYRPGESDVQDWWLASQTADVILCSTPTLAATFDLPEKTVVARNLLEISTYPVAPEPAPDTGKLRILWAGSKTHEEDYAVLTAPLDRLLRKWAGRIEVFFVGSAPGNLLRDWLDRGVTFLDGVPLARYGPTLSQIRPHICLAPLANNAFNQAKSNIRILESWALSAATVASPVGEYLVVKEGEDGLLAFREDEWFSALDRLVADDELRLRLAKAGRTRVEAEWAWENPNCRAEWRGAIREIERRAARKRGIRSVERSEPQPPTGLSTLQAE